MFGHLNLVMNTRHFSHIKVDNGESCLSLGSVQIPIQLIDKVRLVDVLIVPILKNRLILGLDF